MLPIFVIRRPLAAIGMLLCFAAAGLSRAADAPRPPNIVILFIDDLGYGDIAPFGSTINHTPRLDQMAAEGRKLTSFYAAPVCSPSRSSLMTGCYPKRVSIPQVLFPAEATGINADELTLAEMLKARGYDTMCIGKWHLGDQPEFLPTRHGFDHYLGLPYSNDMGGGETAPDFAPYLSNTEAEKGLPQPSTQPTTKSSVKQGRNESAKPKKKTGAVAEAGAKKAAERAEMIATRPPLPLVRDEKVIQSITPAQQDGLTKLYTEEAIKFLGEHKSKPFFLYLAHNAVHRPHHPGKEFAGKNSHGIYSDWVEEVDWSCGQVLDALRDMKLADNTLVIFSSDNGGTTSAVNKPLRGFKASTWEGGMREPTLVWWPGHIPAGTTCDALCSEIDVLPTIAKLVGGELKHGRKIDGKDIWPLIAGDAKSMTPHESFYYFKGNELEAVRTGPWKLHLKTKELYNLDTDIGEKTNTYADHTDVVKKIEAYADEMDRDLGKKGIGPGVRPPGKVKNPVGMTVGKQAAPVIP